ncbi:Speckle-type POZ protein [Araneus ventricosus]|uniref:Speckle-type POZ protein n=1 Tax=Araneus ventricosus TaxID=182803 RepID=A0A4Y2RQE3_ARAVE|nr:Speckle-type POZ protein [Araneus ventricosus]
MATIAKEMDAIDLTEPEMTSVVSSSFIESIKSLLEEGTLSDVSLRAGSQSFPAHKCILSARSPVFKAMFNGNFKKKISKCVEIPDVDENTVRELLSYIYTDKVGELQWRGAADLYRAADKYQMLDLKRRCTTFLKSDLSLSNVCTILVVADMHHDRKLREAAQDFVRQQGEDFFTSDNWRSFKYENSELAWEIVELILCNKQSRVSPNKSGACNEVDRFKRTHLYPDINALKHCKAMSPKTPKRSPNEKKIDRVEQEKVSKLDVEAALKGHKISLSHIITVAFTMFGLGCVICNRVPLRSLGISRLRISSTGTPTFNLGLSEGAPDNSKMLKSSTEYDVPC